MWSITWSRNARHIKTLTQVVDELLRQAFNESSNEMVSMSIEVGCKKTSRLVSSSQGVPEVPTAAGDNRISSITKETRCKELCDYASRRLFATRASGAAQEKQLGEQKTFHKASRRGNSRAATGRGAGRAQCGDSTSTGGAERLHNNRLHQTCRPVNQLRHVCVEKSPLTTRHVATRTLRGQLREERVLITLEKTLAGSRPGGRSGNTTIQSRRVHDRGKPSLKRGAERRLRTDLPGIPSDVQNWTTRGTAENHDHADGEVANRALEPHGVWRGGERSSSARAKTQHVSEHAERENTTWVST